MRTTDRAIRSQSASMDSVEVSDIRGWVVTTAKEVSETTVVSTTAGGEEAGSSSPPLVTSAQIPARIPSGETKKKKTFNERRRFACFLSRFILVRDSGGGGGPVCAFFESGGFLSKGFVRGGRGGGGGMDVCPKLPLFTGLVGRRFLFKAQRQMSRRDQFHHLYSFLLVQFLRQR